MSKFADDCLASLGRLIKHKKKISLDAVAVEAGKKRGAIRRSLDRHAELVKAIDDAAEKQAAEGPLSREDKLAAQVEKLTEERDEYKSKYENLLSERLSMIWQIKHLKDDLIDEQETNKEKRDKKKKQGNILHLV